VGIWREEDFFKKLSNAPYSGATLAYVKCPMVGQNFCVIPYQIPTSARGGGSGATQW